MLTAYYDLACSPPTYDIVAFLCEVERARIERGAEKVSIQILPGPAGGFRRDKFWPCSVDERQKMLDHVAAPMARMLPSIAQVAIWKHRPPDVAPKSIGYGASLYGLRVQVDAMKSGIRPLRPTSPLSEGWPNYQYGNRLVTITLREAEHWPQRNSNVSAWRDAAQAIGAVGFDVLVIRDTLYADELLWKVTTCPQASRDLECRANLYRAAVCNLFVNNGPAWFAMALDAPVLMLRPTVEGVMHTCSAAYFRECGIEPGGQIPSAPSYQRIVWANDSTENIVRAFNEFMSLH